MGKPPENAPGRDEPPYTSLPREQPPPPELEERVVATLRQKGLLREESKRSLTPPLRAALAAAAALVLLLGGAAIGFALRGTRATPTSTVDSRPHFLLLLHETDSFQTDLPEPVLEREYGLWAQELVRQDLLLAAEKLQETGQMLRAGPPGASVVADELDSSSATVSGYFLIRAADYEEAARIARASPHLKYGGTIELRAIAELTHK